MFFRKKRRTPKRVAVLEKEVLDLQSQLEARDRTISVLESENDIMALVVARLEERVRAEGAKYARDRAESENNESHQEGTVRYTA